MNKFFDKMGICVSGLCLVHCLIMPIILLSFPVVFSDFEHSDHDIHFLFGILVLISATLAVYPHCRKSGRKDILGLAVAGVLLILGGFTIGHEISETVEHGLTVIGSILLVIAHYKNIRIKHSTCEDKKAPCDSHH
jgi:hypothetical protein